MFKVTIQQIQIGIFALIAPKRLVQSYIESLGYVPSDVYLESMCYCTKEIDFDKINNNEE